MITYITLHYLDVHKELGVLNSDWKAQKYYDTGKEGGKYAHKVVGSVAGSEENDSDKENIQHGLDGLFDVNNLPKPTTIVACLDDDTAHRIMVFGGDILNRLAKASPTDIPKIVKDIEAFGDSIPEPVKECLDGNA